MTWLNSIFGGSTAANLIAITVGLVLVLLGLFWLFRKIAGSNNIRGIRSRRPRLGVTEAAIVDDKRRLVLIRRDNVEHLVMIGGASDVLVERNIVLVQSAKGAAEPIRAMPVPAGQDDALQADTSQTQDQDNGVQTGGGLIATGAAAGAAAMASLGNAVTSKNDEAEEALENSEFTAAIAESLAEDEETSAESVIETEPDIVSTSSVHEEVAIEAMVETEHEAEILQDEIVDLAAELEEPELLEIEIPELGPEIPPQEPEPEIEIDSSADPEADLPDELVETPTEENYQAPQMEEEPLDKVEPVEEMQVEPVELPAETETLDTDEVTPPSAEETPQILQEEAEPTDPEPVANEARHDDMEDEMQKLLSELAGAKSN